MLLALPGRQSKCACAQPRHRTHSLRERQRSLNKQKRDVRCWKFVIDFLLFKQSSPHINQSRRGFGSYTQPPSDPNLMMEGAPVNRGFFMDWIDLRMEQRAGWAASKEQRQNKGAKSSGRKHGATPEHQRHCTTEKQCCGGGHRPKPFSARSEVAG